jgi:uncharacterized protein YgiM (DUF1202 family)
VNNLQYIGATLTGVAAIATASVSVYTTLKQEPVSMQTTIPSAILIRTGIIYDVDGWTNIRQLPTTDSKILTRLANDIEVTIISDSGNWFQIQTKNNITGFVYKQNILEK